MRTLVNNRHPRAINGHMTFQSYEQKKSYFKQIRSCLNKQSRLQQMVMIAKRCIIHIWWELRKLAVTVWSKATESHYVDVRSYGHHVIWINKMAKARWRGKKGDIKSTCLSHFSPSKDSRYNLNPQCKITAKAPTVFPSLRTFLSVSTGSHSPVEEREKNLEKHQFSNNSSWEQIDAITALYLIPYKNTV